MKKNFSNFVFLRLTALALILCLLPIVGLGETTSSELSEQKTGTLPDWISFLLICNEGMNNDKGNAGNTLMVVSMNPQKGKIRLMMFAWDTFIDYEGYDVPQKLDMPYRNKGAEEAMRVLDENFDLDIQHYMSLNYLNLASLIDEYGGITVDITCAERNALNGMVASKKTQLQREVGKGILSQAMVEMLAQEYYLNDFGPDIHLKGLQAVGFGWLQYDSVVNCCEREVEVIASLFENVGTFIAQRVVFYTNESGYLNQVEGRRAINLDEVTNEDYAFLRQLMAPIFEKSFHNLGEDEIHDIALALAHVGYSAARQGVDIFDHLERKIMPLEATQPYDIIAGAKGHLVDKEANAQAIREFLFADD